jgi:predicted ATPase
MGLVAREREIAALLQACRAAREGHGSVVVMGGEPGAGKTALLDVVAAEQSARLSRVTAVEAEQSIAFATLQALLWPLKDRSDLQVRADDLRDQVCVERARRPW